jgi:hypothetical protein
MALRTWTRAAVAATVVVAALGGATASRASSDAAICKSFSAAGVKYRWSVIGNVTCGKAKPWLARILADRGKPGAKIVIRNGPKGFHCSATADAKGRPFAGACYTGTLAFPKNGFQWFG